MMNKKHFSAFLLLAAGVANAAFPPTTIKGQADTNKAVKFNFQVPNKQATNLGGVTTLIETGNDNMLANPSFEHSTATTSWTATTASGAAETSTKRHGAKSYALTFSASTGDVLQSVTPSYDIGGMNLAASCEVKTSLSTIQVCSLVNGSEQQCVTAPGDNAWHRVEATAVGVSSQSAGVKIKTTSSTTGTVYVDDCKVEPNKNIGTVAETFLVGTLKYASASNCAWTTNSASFANFSADSDCPSPTVTGQITAPGTKIPGAVIPNPRTDGNYLVLVSGTALADNNATTAVFRLSDGTTAQGWEAVSGDGAFGSQNGLFINGNYSFTTSSSATIQIQGKKIGDSNAIVYNGLTDNVLEFKVYFIPGSSQQVVRLDQSDTGYVDFTPSVSTGTWTTQVAKWRRVRSNMEVTMRATATAVGSGVYQFSIPSVGGTINTTAYPTSTIADGIGAHTLNAGPVGGASWSTPSNHQAYGNCQVYVTSTTQVAVLCGGASSATLSATGNPFLDRAAGLGSTVANGGSASAYVNMTFSVPINEWASQNAPLIAGGVTSSSTGTERIERAKVNCSSSSSISSQSGNWISSIGNISSGSCTLSIPSGTFSAAPTCVIGASGVNNTVTISVSVSSVSTTSLTTVCTANSGSSLLVCSNNDYNILCVGPR